MWAPILEKVWAKVNGNYENINNGDSTESIAFFTNAPSRRYDLTDPSTINGNADLLWSIVKYAD